MKIQVLIFPLSFTYTPDLISMNIECVVRNSKRILYGRKSSVLMALLLLMTEGILLWPFSLFLFCRKLPRQIFFFISWGRGFSSASTLCKRPWKEELSKLFHGGKSSFFAEDQ